MCYFGSHSSNGFRMASDIGYITFTLFSARPDILKSHWISNLEVIKGQREEILSMQVRKRRFTFLKS